MFQQYLNYGQFRVKPVKKKILHNSNFIVPVMGKIISSNEEGKRYTQGGGISRTTCARILKSDIHPHPL